MKQIIIKGYNISKQNFSRYGSRTIYNFNDLKLFIPFLEKSFNIQNINEIFRYGKIQQSNPVDHDHNSGFIRGILSEKLNLLLDQWENGGWKLIKPLELTKYKKSTSI